jgi:antitoxin (DNA-binding transcriptional repressor) of toxin-antitoxin stability system
MIATLEQTQSDLLRLVNLVQQGEEVLITSQGRAVAKLTPVLGPQPLANRKTWLAKLAELRTRIATGRTGLVVEKILDEDRGD